MLKFNLFAKLGSLICLMSLPFWGNVQAGNSLSEQLTSSYGNYHAKSLTEYKTPRYALGFYIGVDAYPTYRYRYHPYYNSYQYAPVYRYPAGYPATVRNCYRQRFCNKVRVCKRHYRCRIIYRCYNRPVCSRSYVW